MATKSLEIRINTLNDARAVMQHFGSLNAEADRLGLDSFEVLIDESIHDEAQMIMFGAFRKKCFYSKTKPRPGNVLWTIPPLLDLSPPAQVKRKMAS